MQKIIYYVATSLDGYIAGPNDDVSLFLPQGKGVDQYLADLQAFKTVIMGRRTYEFGYNFGLKPGDAPYPHMQHYIFSNSLTFEKAAPNVQVAKRELDNIHKIKAASETDIYLCGGGTFAGWLLENQLIDQLKIKLNPIILGDGIPLFGSSKHSTKWKLREKTSFEDEFQLLSYDYVQ